MVIAAFHGNRSKYVSLGVKQISEKLLFFGKEENGLFSLKKKL